MSIDRDFIRGSTSLLVLTLLKNEGTLYGYRISKLIQEKSEGILEFKEGTLYPALYKLEDQKLITNEWSEYKGRKRKYYRITNKGLKVVDDKQKEWDVFTKSIGKVINYAQ